MGIGTGIVVFVLGAILAFAVNVQSDVINISLVGYLLMGAGLVVFVISLVAMMRKRQSVTTVRSVDASGESLTERRTATTPDDVA